MKNQMCEEMQKHLFEIISSRTTNQYKIVEILEELLETSANSVYRRMRGETELTFSEMYTLCKKYNISMDEVFNFRSGQNALFHYMPVDLSDQNSYISYLKGLSETFTVLNQQDQELYLTANDIPFYYFGNYPELLYFKLFAWNNTINRNTMSYRDFCTRLDKDTILPLHKKVTHSFMNIPSKEIWINQTIDVLLKLLEHYYDIGAFDSKETVLFLLNQLTSLMDMVKTNAEDGFKGSSKNIPFHLYLCPVDLENNRILLKNGENMSCSIRLYTVNSITTGDRTMCLETLKWINDLIAKSIQISGVSIKERTHFFRSSQYKIDELVNKIKNNT